MATVGTPYVSVLVVASGVTAGLAAYAWRRDEYGTRSFVRLMLVLTVYAVTHAVGLLTPVEPTRLLLNRIQWIATAAVPLAWILFAFEYTGWDEVVTPRVVGVVAAVPALTVGVVWTNPWHGLMWTHNSLDVVNGFAILTQEFGPWFWVYVAYSYTVILVGIALFARLVWVSDRLFLDQSVLLLLGAAAPLLASVLTVLGLSIVRNPTLDMTPYGFTVSGLAFGYAIFRRRLFDIVPATRQLGRRAAIHDLDDGVIIVDRNGSVIYSNPAAATLLDTSPETLTGAPIDTAVETDEIDLDADDATAEIERNDAVYEIRTSPIRDRRDSIAGHTLLISDVTEQRDTVHRLERQREKLRRLEVLNSVLRGVNRVLVSATSREEIERGVCDRLAGSELYRTAFVTDRPTWSGDADRWTVAGDQIDPRTLPDVVDDGELDPNGRIEATVTADGPDGAAERGSWAVVPLVHRRTVYGMLGLYSDRASLADGSPREREILTELGATVGHAINAIENRRLLTGGATVELELRSRDEHAPLLSVASRAECELEVEGVVPGGENGPVAYISATEAPGQAATALEDASTGSVRPIRTDGGEGLFEWDVPRGSLVGTVLGHCINALRVTVDPDHVECVVEAASEDDVRAMFDELQEAFPDTRLAAKRQRDPGASFERSGHLPGVMDDLTDRQREALEAAYRAGYFEWPRESSAGEVAETLDISRPTFQGHLRKAEDAVLAGLFESGDSE